MNQRLKAMDEMDACLFSGDMLFNEEERTEFKKMVARWQKALDDHDAQLVREHQQGFAELEYPKCPHCGHQLDDDEMSSQAADLRAAAPIEAREIIECPACDQEYWVRGGFKPHYTSAFSEEELQ